MWFSLQCIRLRHGQCSEFYTFGLFPFCSYQTGGHEKHQNVLWHWVLSRSTLHTNETRRALTLTRWRRRSDNRTFSLTNYGRKLKAFLDTALSCKSISNGQSSSEEYFYCSFRIASEENPPCPYHVVILPALREWTCSLISGLTNSVNGVSVKKN